MFDEHIEKMASFETIDEARVWVVTIIAELVALKNAPGGMLQYKLVLNKLVAPWHGKGKDAFRKEIDGLVKIVEMNQRQAKFEEATEDKQRDKLDTNEEGIVLGTQKNIVEVLIANKHIEYGYCNFLDQRIFKFIGQPLWPVGLEKHYIEIKYFVPHAITGSMVNRWYLVSGHIAELTLYLHQFFPDERTWHELDRALDVVTKRNQINIYQDWMDHGLPEWDGNDHMDFLYRHAGAENKDWARVIGHLMFLPLVARCYEPGFDVRGNIILEGLENTGKSWLAKSIAFDDRYATPFEINKNTSVYEIARQLHRQTVVELADKGGMDNKTYDQVKAFLTYTKDPNRRMNQDEVEHIKRICILMITCNESEGYLKGEVDGDTRFYPIKCNGMINVEAIIAELPQLYAQAKFLYEFEKALVRPNDAEMAMQQEQVKPRQKKSDYYYWMLGILKLHRDQMAPGVDDGFNMDDDMKHWCEAESWYATKPWHQHLRVIRNVLKKHFYIDSSVKKVPNVTNDKTLPSRKWRYSGNVDWYTFIDNLEE